MTRPASYPVVTERTTRSIRVWLIAVGAVLALALLFLLLPFKLAYSATTANSDNASGESHAEARPQNTLTPVAVWVEEKDRLSTTLRDRLVTELQASGRYQPHIVEGANPGPDDVPLLRVWIARPGLSWTPFYAQTRGEVRFGFSNYTRDIVLDKEVPFLLNGPADQYLYISRGTLNLEDHTYGLVSLPGYWHWIAEKSASEIVAKLP